MAGAGVFSMDDDIGNDTMTGVQQGTISDDDSIEVIIPGYFIKGLLY